MANAKIYIMDENKLCGIGVPGELCVGGVLVGAGYLNRADLTEKAFLKNVFGPGSLYRTGDLACWKSDGNIKFLGRIDEQVKIHGQRVELGEIESKIREIQQIVDCAVIAKNDRGGTKSLYAYLVSDISLNLVEVRNELFKVLPDYMVPAYIMQIEKLPANQNGKLDKKALPDINMESLNDYVEPATEEEKLLGAIFARVLGRTRVSVEESFFSLGGDSIKAIRIVSEIREQGYELTVRTIMKEKTVRRMAAQLKKIDIIKYPQNQITGTFSYLPAQKKLIETNKSTINHYNQSLFLEFNGQVNVEILYKTLNVIVKHHDALRTIINDDKQIIQEYKSDEMFDLKVMDTNMVDNVKEYIECQCNKIQNSIDVISGPLVKVGVFKGSFNDYIFFCIHHLVVDGVSWRIIIEDFISIYNTLKKGGIPRLPQKTASIENWITFMESYVKSEKGRKEHEYWTNINAQIPACLLEIKNIDSNSKAITKHIVIDSKYTSCLLNEANRAYGTDIQDILLSALAFSVNKSTGKKQLAVVLEGHGRNDFDGKIDIGRTVGFFTSMYPVIIRAEDSLRDTIIHNKEVLRAVPNGGIVYNCLKYETNYKPDIIFNYLGNYGDLVQDDSVFKDLAEFSGGRDISEDTESIYKLEINCYVMDNELTIDISYSSGYQEDSINNLIREYEETIIDAIKHCADADITMTGSDFGDSTLTKEDLNILDDLLNQL